MLETVVPSLLGLICRDLPNLYIQASEIRTVDQITFNCVVTNP
jgi:hypothetical protein